MTSKKSYVIACIVVAALIFSFSSPAFSGSVSYDYDLNGRLIRASSINRQSSEYSYDPVGNREHKKTRFVSMVAVGAYHSAVLLGDGTVWTWGGNDSGQLGDGTRDENVPRPTPMRVKGEGGVGSLVGVIAIDAGDYHTVALKENSTVWAWGINAAGQLGTSTSPDNYSSTPRQVDGLSDVVAIAVGSNHALALTSDGTVWAWGFNGSGQPRFPLPLSPHVLKYIYTIRPKGVH